MRMYKFVYGLLEPIKNLYLRLYDINCGKEIIKKDKIIKMAEKVKNILDSNNICLITTRQVSAKIPSAPFYSSSKKENNKSIIENEPLNQNKQFYPSINNEGNNNFCFIKLLFLAPPQYDLNTHNFDTSQYNVDSPQDYINQEDKQEQMAIYKKLYF